MALLTLLQTLSGSSTATAYHDNQETGGMVNPNLRADLRRLLAELERDTEASPTLDEMWPAYWSTEAQHLKSARRTLDAWAAMRDVRGSDGLMLRERQALTSTAEVDEEVRAELHKRKGHTGDPVKPATVNRALIVLRRLLNWAVEQRKIAHCPLRVHLEREDNVKQTAIRTEAEFQHLLAACAHSRDRAFLILLFDTGLRCMEGLTLQRHQLVMKQDGGAHVHLYATKTDEARTVVLTRRAATVLAELPNRGAYYFANPDTGRPYSKRYMFERVQLAVARSGLAAAPGETINIHTMRHSFVCIRRERDHWPEERIMRQTGHKTRSAFMRYGRGNLQETDESMLAVEARISAESHATQLPLFSGGRMGPKSAEEPAFDVAAQRRVRKSI